MVVRNSQTREIKNRIKVAIASTVGEVFLAAPSVEIKDLSAVTIGNWIGGKNRPRITEFRVFFKAIYDKNPTEAVRLLNALFGSDIDVTTEIVVDVDSSTKKLIDELLIRESKSAYKMAQLCGVSAANFTHWRQGKNKGVRIDKLVMIADASEHKDEFAFNVVGDYGDDSEPGDVQALYVIN